MSATDVKNEVMAIISEYMGISLEDVKSEMSLVNDLGCDSLDCIEITMTIEEKFEIEIPDSDAANLDTVDQIVKYVESKVIK